MAAGMLRGFAFEGVSPLPKFVTMCCPMPELKTRILVVDDDQRLRDLLVRYLGGEGYEVKAVPDAPGMDKQLARERYDLVVLDLMLPGEGKALPLTTGEFSVLKVLVQHPREPLSRDKLMELARGREYEVFDRSIDVQISRLRKIVEDDPSHPKHIQTVWGFGYVFVPDNETK